MRATAVIGANYGDCGKGLIVDKVCVDTDASLVVRFNGGAQAGHTVCMPDGRRHVFHHVGAGAFRGIPTYLSRFFVCNPILFNEEIDALAKLGVHPVVYADMDCMVTTPWDMLLNQIREKARGDHPHGSCGVGFAETISRNVDYGVVLRLRDLIDEHYATRKGHGAVMDYFYDWARKFANRGFDGASQAVHDADISVDRWVRDVALFLERVTWVAGRIFPLSAYHPVFEGAQGLGLDQNNVAAFPYLTRSNTGLRNVLELCSGEDIDDIEAIYVSRSYLTRHGAGPLEGDGLPLGFVPLEDKTNVDHPFQGRLRIAPLDVAKLHARIMNDFRFGVRASIALTHFDAPGLRSFPTEVADGCGMRLRYIGFGPCADQVVEG